MSKLLDSIVETKKREVEALIQQGFDEKWLDDLPVDTTKNPAGYNFAKAIRRKPGSKVRVIAECKKASPSLGLLCENYNPYQIALKYMKIGASALSVLTDRDFFQGHLDDLVEARRCGLPAIRKDFIIDPVQIYEAKKAGASAILLIVRILTQAQLIRLSNIASELGLDVLVETHSENEVERAMDMNALIIGINHRNLDTLEMDLGLTARLAPLIRSKREDVILIAESGIETKQGRQYVDPYCDAVLIGSALMNSKDMSKTWQTIFND